MWLCVLQLLLLLTTSKWTWATPEEAYAPLPADSEDSKDGSMILFLEGRSLFGNDHHLKSDIEARRRSTFEKNFMRFGRSRSMPLPNDDVAEDEEFADDLDRAVRSQNKNDNFIRFGRGSDFIRFGRDSGKYVRRANTDKQNNFIRFGRSLNNVEDIDNHGSQTKHQQVQEHKRNRRFASTATTDGEDRERELQEKFMTSKRPSGSNIVRFGRNDNFMRFGRGGEDNGITPEEIDANAGKPNENAAGRQSNHLSFVSHLRLHDPTLLRLLTDIAAKMKSERSNCARLGNAEVN